MSVLHEMLEAGRRRREGRKRHWGRQLGYEVDGRKTSIKAEAQALGVSANLLQFRMKKHDMTLEQAVHYYRDKRAWQEERREKEARAVDEIVNIILNP